MSAVAIALICLAWLVVVFAALWLLSRRLADVGIVDIAWGPGFALVGWIWLGLRGAPNTAALLLLACVTLWALRLGLHLRARHARQSGEDARYAAMRARAPDSFARDSFWKVFMLQAVILWALALPIHLAFGWPTQATVPPAGLIALGLLLFTAGFLIEVLADLKLARFRADPANRGGLLTSGLFAWSRHPNYFGEAVLWFGIGLLSVAASGSWLALAGPAALLGLLLRVSGVTLLDEHLRHTRPGFEDYARRTSAFLPWPPKRR